MPQTTSFPPGTFCWTELATSDAEGAKKFYNTIFGWGHHDDPVPGGMVYSMLQQAGSNVGGLYAMTDEMKQMGIPPHWLNYVNVESADKTAAKAKELGAQVPRPPMDVMDVGRMAVITDPTGAHFGVWEAKKSMGTALVNEPVSVVWDELLTNDVEKAGSFYTKLFHWGTEVMPMPTGDYTMFKNGGRGAGGMMAMTPEMPDMPPAWVVYFAVEDPDQTTQQVAAAGGQVLQPPMTVPGVGKMAAYLDPQGAGFAVIKLDQPPEPLP